MRCLVLIFCTIAVLASHANALSSEAIIGRKSESRPVNYFVTIKRGDKDVCRGGIIGTWLILTAASCVYNKTTNDFIPGSLSIVAGSGNATVVVDVEKIHVPKAFTEQNGTIGDIAVLKLKQNLNLRENRKTLQRLTSPRRLRDNGYKNYLDEPAKVSTFDQDHNITLPYLLKARVVEAEECKARYGKAVHENEMCAQIEDSSFAPMKLCENDLGGPLVFNDRVVIGVAVIPPQRCILNGEPAIYTRVSSYLPFISAARYDDEDDNAVVKVL